MPSRLVRGIAWLHTRRGKINGLVLKTAGFYFGYRILHHEIYETDSAEPILIGLGLWLAGVPVATFFDGLKKLGAQAEDQVKAGVTGEAPSTELKLVDKPASEEANGT